MKIKMLEVMQGRGVSGVLLPDDISVAILEIGREYNVNDAFGQWLVENGKAEASAVTAVHYGAQPVMEERHDDEKSEMMTVKPKRGRK